MVVYTKLEFAKGWQTPQSLSWYDKAFLVALKRECSLSIGEGDFSQYEALAHMGLVKLTEYTYFNRHISLTPRGKAIARQLIQDENISWDEYIAVKRNEYNSMNYPTVVGKE